MNLFNPTLFNGVLATMTLMGIVVMAALFFIEAGYGMMYRRTWGPSISNKTGWVLMEAPVFIVMLLLWWYSDRRTEVVPVVFLILFEIHYAQRSFIFPLLMRGHNRMPLAIIVMGIVFNVINAYMQGGWIFHVASQGLYTVSWLYSPQFIAGTVIFIAGMAINLNSDYIIRHLRKPGDTKHYIPRGGMFRYVSSANYLGEFTEWVGFAILTWSAAGAVFAWWTLANLAPRAWRIHKRYSKEFGKEFDDLHLRCIIPFIF